MFAWRQVLPRTVSVGRGLGKWGLISFKVYWEVGGAGKRNGGPTVIAWVSRSKSRWRARRRGILDNSIEWQRVGWIYWLDMARNISFWCALNRELLARSLDISTTHPRIHLPISPPIVLLAYLLIRLLALSFLSWLGSATSHRSYKPTTHPFSLPCRVFSHIVTFARWHS